MYPKSKIERKNFKLFLAHSFRFVTGFNWSDCPYIDFDDIIILFIKFTTNNATTVRVSIR